MQILAERGVLYYQERIKPRIFYAMIVIVSENKDFAHSLAEHIVRELAMVCECVPTVENLEKLQGVTLVVYTDKKIYINGLPSVLLTLPLRLRDALMEIKDAFSRIENERWLGADFLLSIRKKTLSQPSKNKEILLTDKETQLLEAIFLAGQAGIGKNALLKEIWGIEADLNTHTLETHIYRLRAKLKELSGSEIIVAIENGYKLKL